MEIRDLHVATGVSPAEFHSAIRHNPKVAGMRFRTFVEDGLLYVVRVPKPSQEEHSRPILERHGQWSSNRGNTPK